MSNSGLGEANYTTDYSEDSEAGYQASVDTDNDGEIGHPDRERMYKSGPGHGGEDPFRIYKDHQVSRASPEHLVRTPNGPKPAYVITTQWNDAERNPAMNDHTQGWNSTYEDAYIMVRRRHSSADSSKQKGNRKQTIIKKHGKRIYSIPEFDQNQMRRDDFPFRQETVQKSEDELNKYPDLPQCTYDSALLTQTNQTDSKMHRKIGPHTLKRSESADLLKVKKNICLATASPVTTIDMDYPWLNTPALKTSQSPKLGFRSDSRNGLHYERRSSVASNDSDQNLPPHLLGSYLETESQSYGQVQSRQKEYSKHRPCRKSSHKVLQKSKSSFDILQPQDAVSVASSEDLPRSTGDMRSRNLYHLPRNSNPNISTFQQGRNGYLESRTSTAS